MKQCLNYDHLSITGAEASGPEICYIYLFLLQQKEVKQQFFNFLLKKFLLKVPIEKHKNIKYKLKLNCLVMFNVLNLSPFHRRWRLRKSGKI